MKTILLAILLVTVTAVGYVITTRDTVYSADIEMWNSTEVKSYAITDIERRAKKLNTAKKGDELSIFLAAVSAGLDTEDLNSKDKERLCRLYKRFAVNQAYTKCQNDLISSGYRTDDVKAWLRSTKSQLVLNATGRGGGGLKTRLQSRVNSWWRGIDVYSNGSLLQALSSIDASLLDENDRYQIAKTQLQYTFNEDDAVEKLRSIIENSDNERLVSRSYFVLARYYLGREDVEMAEGLYAEYVEVFGRKPDFAFFVNKANQRRLQIQISQGEISDIHHAKQNLLAFVGDAEDLRIFFDTARKLAEAGYNRDALKVFLDGVGRLESSKIEELPLYKLIRLYVEVVRSGNAIGVGYEVQNKYIQLVDQKLEYGLSENLHKSDELSYLYSQSLLWAAEAYVIHEKFALAESFYGRFLKQFPVSDDYEFALYKLLSICGEVRQCYRDDVIKVLVPVTSGYREEQEIGNFIYLAAHIKNTAWKGEIQKWLNSAG